MASERVTSSPALVAGIASRLDLTFISLLYGLGISILAMVGANLGAGNVERSYRVAAVGTLMAAAIGGGLGLW